MDMHKAQTFGGDWTAEKLSIVQGYSCGYLTALKNQPFRLIYVDACAGYGYYQIKDTGETQDGSPLTALNAVSNGEPKRAFDHLVFIEKSFKAIQALNSLPNQFPDRNIDICHADANDLLPKFCQELKPNDRAIIFLDPFNTTISWQTIELLAQTKRADCLILCPVWAISRMMPKGSPPTEGNAKSLDRIFGGRRFWYPAYERSLFDDIQMRMPGVDEISDLYKARLETVFTEVAPQTKRMKNEKNAPLFDLFFASSNLAGAKIAVRIATSVMKAAKQDKHQPTLNLFS